MTCKFNLLLESILGCSACNWRSNRLSSDRGIPFTYLFGLNAIVHHRMFEIAGILLKGRDFKGFRWESQKEFHNVKIG